MYFYPGEHGDHTDKGWGSHRYMDWQRSVLLPMQEMFGQIGIGRYWESEPAPIEAGMLSQHNSPQREGGARRVSPDHASCHSMQDRSCKASTTSWVTSSQLSMDRAHSIPAHV